MDLRRKLALLSGAPVARRAQPAPSEDVDFDSDPVSVETPSVGDPRHSVLSELRSKISEILGRPSAPRKLAEPSDTSLSFARVERPEGLL